MRIRTQLILASFVLAVVPLGAIVTYSYHSSRRALESAYVREANQLTQQMDRRLASIRAELDQRLALVSALPVTDASSGDVGGSIAAAMGDVTSMVEALEFKPLPATPAPAQRKPTQVAETQSAEPQPETKIAKPAEAMGMDAKAAALDAKREFRVVQIAGAPDANGNVPSEAFVPPPPGPHAPHPPPGSAMVIDLPAVPVIPRYVISEEQRELLAEIKRLSIAVSKQGLDRDQREDLTAEMHDLQEELNRVVSEDAKRYGQEVAAAREAARVHRRVIASARETLQRDRVRGGTNAGATAPAPPTAATPAPAIAATPKVDSVEPTPAVSAAASTPSVEVRKPTAPDRAQSRAAEKKTTLLLGKEFKAPVRKEGEVVGQLSPRINNDAIVSRVLGSSTDGTEVPFAMDTEGTLYTRTPEERATLDRLGIPKRLRENTSVKNIPGWIVSASRDEQSGLRIGVARPVGDNLEELRRTAARNFSLGLGLILFAVAGIIPLSNHLTRDVKLVTEGAERIAHGDLMTRLPVKTKNELGQLAKAFNRMAEDLSLQQQKLLEQERARKEQELQQRLMSVEYERKSVELEDARRFQLSMLPKEVPQDDRYDIAVFTRTATEVGGDYYDFHCADKGVLSVAIGDATGHGAKAGTMVTVVKTLFSGYGGESPAHFLGGAAEKIKRMELGRMSMALSVGRFNGHELTLASAGMPPVLVHRSAPDEVQEIALEATPLGTLGVHYDETSLRLGPGDTVLFMTDGFPELLNDAGQQFGYTAALDAFALAARAEDANGVIASLAQTAREWHGDAPPNDDVTFVVVRIA